MQSEIRQTNQTRVLIVDDNALQRTLYQLILSKAGYHVEVAGDGQRALELCELSRFDLVVSDVNMPRMNGDELILELRRRYPHMRFRLVSTVADSWTHPTLSCLPKPDNPQSLLLMVKAALAGSPTGFGRLAGPTSCSG